MSAAPRIGLVAIGGSGWMGGANYVRNLAAAIHAAAPETPVSWFCGESLGPEWREVAPRWPVRRPGRLARWLGTHPARFRRRLEAAGVDFLYPLTYDNTYNLGLPFPLGPALGSCAWAGWIPDFQHRYLPEFFTPEELRWREAEMAKLAAEAPRVFLSSGTALADFQQFFPAHAAKGTLLTFRVRPPAPVVEEEAADLPPRFFLVCNQFWKHKNHRLVFEALRLLHARGVPALLLCTGAMEDYRGDDGYLAGLHALLAEGSLATHVRLLGLVSRPRLLALLRRAVAIIQPSLFEGWSTVLEDARAWGRPSLVSDLPVHREQNPPGACFFPPTSAEALAELMATAWREWPAGPDPAAEAAAREAAVERFRAWGARFLALAQNPLSSAA